MWKQRPRRRVLAVASGGGHWVQLMRLRAAFVGTEMHYATVDSSAAADVAPAPLWTFVDSNQNTKLKLIMTTLKLTWIVLRVRPDVIVTTGAAPGYLALRVGGLLGARTMFIDSIANAQELSMSARLSKGHADRLLVQWPDVARETGADYSGAVI
ncbi:MAG: UDP-N-acetylglucosamine--LPS N-acetylglucosamine transferase [Pseudomonadota bacterium]